MEIARPLPPSLSSSQPPSLSHPRHRRAAFSGRLLNLFTKAKSAPEQPRPVISHPQPLQSHIPIRPKRVYREVSNDENEPPSPSPRPRFRARLHSNSSVAPRSDDTVLRSPSPGRKLHTPPRGDRTRPLKSALKKSASENVPPPASPHSRVLSSSSLAPEALPKSPRSKVVTRISGGAWMPFSSSSRNHATRAPSEAGHRRPPSTGARQKKTVSFALDEPEPDPRSSTSKPSRARVSSPGELSHWDEIAQELDASATSRASSTLKRKAEDYPEPRRSSVPPRPGSPTVTRRAVFKPESSPPVSFRRPLYSRRIPHDDSRPVDEQPNDTDKLALTPSEIERRPARTFIGGIVDAALQECAREKIRSPPRNVKAAASSRHMEGPPGVLRRITADIVPNERHSVVWDASERDTFAWGGTIILRDAKAASYFCPRHCIKDFQLEFCALPEPRSGVDATSASPTDPDAPPTYDWRASFTGHFLARHEVRARLDVVRGIALEPDFVFVAPEPRDPAGAGPHAWMVHFWVPVPLALFARAVHRTFVCRAKVVVGGHGHDTPETVIPAGCVAAGIESLKSDEFIALAGGARDGRAEER